jgi:hypothetical protein
MITRDIHVPNGTIDEVDIQENKAHSDATVILFLVREMVINRLCPAVAWEGMWLRDVRITVEVK